MGRGTITYHPVTSETEQLVRTAIRKLRDRQREAVREHQAEIDRLTKMLTDEGYAP